MSAGYRDIDIDIDIGYPAIDATSDIMIDYHHDDGMS